LPLAPGDDADPMQVSDEKLAGALARYARLARVVLDDPERWLGVDADADIDTDAAASDAGAEGSPEERDRPEPGPSLARRAVSAASDRVFGEVPPGSPGWSQLPEEQRSDWWVQRIGVVAGLAAATPRYAGALADRLPLQAGLGAAAAGLAVCAVAREHGLRDPDDWVPLLATVLFKRTLPTGSAPPAATTADSEDGAEDGAGSGDEPPGTLRRAARTLWRLARTFGAVSDLFDERPRGSLLARAVAKVPVIGVAGGWFDERGAIHGAARRTQELLARSA
jgi:hypothetical protein